MRVYDLHLSTICQTPTILSRQRCTQNFEVEGMGEGEDPEEENLAEEASVKSTVSISRWPLITLRTTRYLNNFYSTRSSSLSLVSSFSVYTRENSIENLNQNENRPSQSCPTSPTKIALSFDSPLLNKVDFENSFSLFIKLMVAQ